MGFQDEKLSLPHVAFVSLHITRINALEIPSHQAELAPVLAVNVVGKPDQELLT